MQNVESGPNSYSFRAEVREGVAEHRSVGKAQWVHILAEACTRHLPRELGRSAAVAVAGTSPPSWRPSPGAADSPLLPSGHPAVAEWASRMW